MSTIFGILGVNDTDRVFNLTVGQDTVLTLIREYLTRRDDQIDMLISVFVSSQMEDFKLRYKLPGTGRMQNMGFAPLDRPDVTKTTGEWDVAFPLESHQSAIGWDRVTREYFSVMDMEKHITGIDIQNRNSVRFNVLRAMFNNTQRSFIDKFHGTLSLEPFANGDANLYPPVIGSESEATEDHYLNFGLAASAIDDTNNPYVTIEADLVHHFGKSQGNDNVAVFINSAQKALTQDLSDFDEEHDRFVQVGTQTSVLTGLPTMHPGRVIGRTNGCWVIEWDFIPADFMLGVHLDVEPPLKRRMDPADTGLTSGLQIIHEDDNMFPLSAQYWENRYGYACANRLNGVVMDLSTGGTYTIPTEFA